MGSSKIILVGIKESDDGKNSLCFDALCSNCGVPSSTTILTDVDFTAKQLAAEIFTALKEEDVDELNHQYVSPIKKKSKKNKKNKKSVRMNAFNIESKKFVDFLNSCENYTELLREIGLTDEEIERYGNGK